LAVVPPPGAGFVTVTLNVPAVAISVAVIAAFTCVALTNVVVLAVPLKFTTEDEFKFVPFTVRVKAVPPFVALVGERDVIAGTGLFTVKEELMEVPPPGAGFKTVTLSVPAVAMSVAGTTSTAAIQASPTPGEIDATTDDGGKYVYKLAPDQSLSMAGPGARSMKLTKCAG